jgi:hypothetical protein
LRWRLGTHVAIFMPRPFRRTWHRNLLIYRGNYGLPLAAKNCARVGLG